MANFDQLTAEIGAPQQISTGFAYCIRYTPVTSLSGGQQNFAGCLAVSWAGTLYIHFGAPLPLTEFCQLQHSLCVKVLRSITTQHSSSLRQQLCGVAQGMELRNFAEDALYIRLGWALAHILV